MGASPSAEVKKAISLYFTALKSTKIALGGKDLRKLGYEPGPIYSEILTTLLIARLEGEVHSPKEEIEWVQRKFEKGKKVPRRVQKPRFSAAKSVGGV